MSEAAVAETARPTGPVGRALFQASLALAILGGVVFCALALLMTVSIVGRSFFATPVRGYFELVGLGTGVAIFAFLPYCQMVRENVVVDFFLAGAPARLRAACDAAGCLIYGLIVSVLVWRTVVGGIDIRDAGQRTTMLEIDLWMLFPWSVLCLVLLCLTCCYTLAQSIRDARGGDRR